MKKKYILKNIGVVSVMKRDEKNRLTREELIALTFSNEGERGIVIPVTKEEAKSFKHLAEYEFSISEVKVK